MKTSREQKGIASPEPARLGSARRYTDPGRRRHRRRGHLAGRLDHRLTSVPPQTAAGSWPGYSSVWSSTSASGAFFLTDSIPFSADCLRSYVSLVAMTWPFVATRLKWYLPLEPFLPTNLPAILPPR